MPINLSITAECDCCHITFPETLLDIDFVDGEPQFTIEFNNTAGWYYIQSENILYCPKCQRGFREMVLKC